MENDVVVVVVTHNSERVIGDLLESLGPALGELSAEVVVVDNASTDRTIELLSDYPEMRVILSRNLGYAAGINKGVDVSSDSHAILVLNPDVRLKPGSIEIMFASLDRSRIGVVVPQVRRPDGSLDLSLRRDASILRAVGLSRTGLAAFCEYVTRPSEYQTAHPVDWAVGAVMLVSSECHRVLGGWDESFFLYSEETDFCLRARDHGFQIWFEPSAVATHIGGDSGRSGRTNAMQSVNRVRLYRRRHGRLTTLAYFALTLLSETTWWLRGGSPDVVAALVRPSCRPPELGCSHRLIPC